MAKAYLPGATLNDRYNAVVDLWNANAAKGRDMTQKSYDHSCEDCEASLIGKQVYETAINWLCESCYEKEYTTW